MSVSAVLDPRPMPGASVQRPTLRVLIWFLLRLALSLGLFGTAIWYTSGTLDWRQLALLDAPILTLCLMLSASVIIMLGWRWRYVAATLSPGRDLPGIAAFSRITWIGLAVNQVLPSIVGGDAVRASMLARHRVPLAGATASVLIDRLYGMIGLAILCLTGAHLLDPGLLDASLVAVAIVCVAVAGLAAGLFAGSRVFAPVRRAWPLLRDAASRRSAPLLVVAAIAGHLANIAIFLVIANALGADLPVLPAIAVLSAVLFVSALPVSIAGWGIRELTLVQAFGHLAVAQEKIILASVVYGLFMLATQVLGFLLIVGRHRS